MLASSCTSWHPVERRSGWTLYVGDGAPVKVEEFSQALEPAFAFVETFRPVLPYGLGFAAGAMVFMVFLELMPEAYEKASKPAIGVLVCVSLGAMLLFQRYI